MAEIDFVRAERDALKLRIQAMEETFRILAMRPMFCRGVDSQLVEYDGGLIREQQGCENAKESQVLQIKRLAVREIRDKLECRQELENCFGRTD